MSNIADLIHPEKFATEPGPSAKLLRRRVIFGAAALLVAGGIGIAGYHASAGTAPPAAPVAVSVTVASVSARPVQLWQEFSGRLTAVDSAEIRPEVNGRITEIRFKDGQQVKAGDILFVIDPRPYEAAVAKAAGDLATAQNNAKLAQVEFDRASRLLNVQAVARDYYDQRANTKAVDEAAVQSSEAALAQARLDVDHAYVKAPISGRISRAELTVGNLVQTSPSSPLLTTIVSDGDIYADFDVDEQSYLESVRSGATTASEEQKIPVELTAQGDSGLTYKGAIESFDNKIDTGTGTIRARFANDDHALLPGMFVSVRLAGAAKTNAILVPEDAIGSDQSKRFVFVVGGDHKAAFREIALGREVNGQRVVLSGLRSGETIVTGGIERLASGDTVAPLPAGNNGRRILASR